MGGRPRRGMDPTFFGVRPASSRARRSSISIWALTLRNSSAAHLANASWTAGSIRRSTCLRSLTAHEYSVPVLTTGEAGWSLQSTTRRLLTIAAFRSSSRLTMSRSSSRSSASSTIPTAPSTMRERAATTALACCRRSIAWAISAV